MTEKAASKIGSISDLLNAPRAEYIGDIKVNVIAPMLGKLFGEIEARVRSEEQGELRYALRVAKDEGMPAEDASAILREFLRRMPTGSQMQQRCWEHLSSPAGVLLLLKSCIVDDLSDADLERLMSHDIKGATKLAESLVGLSDAAPDTESSAEGNANK
tara:strand:+ start:4611 stop:5087 length:477 start_codon:yes stop_codon:yes gene_type:complete